MVVSRFLIGCLAAGALVAVSPVRAQELIASAPGLPESPGALLAAGQKTVESEITGTASVKGVVLDDQGSPIPGAKVILAALGEFGTRTTLSDDEGNFSFDALPPEHYRVEVVAVGFAPYATAEFPVRAGEAALAPKLALRISAASTTIDVSASPEQIAEAEVQMQEKQRVLGVLPNFYTSYIWDARPMTGKQKYRLATRAIFDPFSFLITAGVAGAEHYHGTYPGYGPGFSGYATRYAAAYGDALSARFIGSAILPSVLHQDPRYFYQGSGTVASRAGHAVGSTFLCRGDNGKMQVNYSHLLGSLAAGAIANAYHPPDSRGARLTFQTFGITTGANMVGNLFREFLLRSLEPSVPAFANGQPIQ